MVVEASGGGKKGKEKKNEDLHHLYFIFLKGLNFILSSKIFLKRENERKILFGSCENVNF